MSCVVISISFFSCRTVKRYTCEISCYNIFYYQYSHVPESIFYIYERYIEFLVYVRWKYFCDVAHHDNEMKQKSSIQSYEHQEMRHCKDFTYLSEKQIKCKILYICYVTLLLLYFNYHNTTDAVRLDLHVYRRY